MGSTGPHVEFRERRVLDVGCGNGYYGWRMLQAGASLVLGFDPFLLFLMQFEAVRRYMPPELPHYVLPLTDEDIPANLNLFDVTLSMGVLYHRTSPIDHLQSLWHSLRSGGTLLLETLIIESDDLDQSGATGSICQNAKRLVHSIDPHAVAMAQSHRVSRCEGDRCLTHDDERTAANRLDDV